MSRGVQVGSIVAPTAAIALGITFDQLLRFGGDQCEVYCGPGGLLLPLLLFGVVPLAWLLGIVLSVFALARSGVRAWWGWVGLSLSLVIPVALLAMYATTH